MNKFAAVVLAGGKGTRMNEGEASPIPKVMFQINGLPIIRYTLDHIKEAGIDRIVLVVGYKHEMIEEFLGNDAEYALQEEQLGTGHAVAMAKDHLLGQSEAILAVYGDMPLVKSESIINLMKEYEKVRPTIAMLSVILKDPKFWAFGRVVRGRNGDVIKIIEQKDCTSEELEIKESNVGFYIFDAEWLWSNIDKLNNSNVQKEYYLTDMIKLARNQRKKIIAIPTNDETEVIGINTKEQLKEAEEVLRSRSN